VTLLARRREEEEKPEERRSVVARPPQPRPSFLHLQSAIGNRAASDFLAHELLVPAVPVVPGVPAVPFLIPDGAVPAPGQIPRAGFLAALREAVRQAAEEGLAGSGHTARGCPWIEHYFRFYERQSAGRIEADLLRYVPAARDAASAEELLAAAAGHVRASVRRWAATGELTGVPRGLPGAGLVGALARELAAVQAELGEGRPLDGAVRARMEQALETPLGDVRLHTDETAARLARRQGAPAFAVGRHVAFDQGEYRPGTLAGDALLAHELAHVSQQEGAEREAAGSPALERDADSAAAGAVARLWSRGRPLPTGLPRSGKPRLRSGLALQRCTPNSDRWFLPYQQRFNELWNQEPYKSKPTAFDPGLSSKGPRTERSRAIFERLYLEDAELREAYDENKGGLRERIDTYTGPEGLNLINSPRLRALEQVFSRYSPPVSGRTYDRFKQEVATAAGALDDADRQAINLSNEWARQINLYVRGADRRREILGLLNPPVAPSSAPAPAGTPEEQLTQEQKVRRFFDRWGAALSFRRGFEDPVFIPGVEDEVRYEGHGQLFQVLSFSGIANPGQVLYVRVRVSRGSTEIASPAAQLFPAGQRNMPPIVIPIREPATVPATGDVLTVVVELLESDLKTVRGTPKHFDVPVKPEIALTRAAVEAIAKSDDDYLNDTTKAGLLGKMRAQGGLPANVAENVSLHHITLRALTQRHDSGAYVEAELHRPDPGKLGYFVGTDYSKSFVDVPGIAFQIPKYGPRFIAANRTPQPRAPSTKRSDEELSKTLVHEAVHALDVRPDSDTSLERYKTEFRAYWMEGDFGPPLEGTCAKPAAKCTDLLRSCLDTNYCAELPPPGPKTPRSRRIFNHLYGSATYTFVRESYDENVNGFRQAVDQYVIPDGIDLIASLRLDELRTLISEWSQRQALRRAHERAGGPPLAEPAFPFPDPGFAGFRARVRAYLYEEGQAPPHGRLNDDEKRQVRGNRSWRDLVEREIPDTDQQRQIKQDLGIPS
jgi:hypothetical protein